MSELTPKELQVLLDNMAEHAGRLIGNFIVEHTSRGLDPEDTIDVIGIIIGAVLADFGVETANQAGLIMAESVEDGFKQAKLMDLLDPKDPLH